MPFLEDTARPTELSIDVLPVYQWVRRNNRELSIINRRLMPRKAALVAMEHSMLHALLTLWDIIVSQPCFCCLEQVTQQKLPRKLCCICCQLLLQLVLPADEALGFLYMYSWSLAGVVCRQCERQQTLDIMLLLLLLNCILLWQH